MSRYFYAQGSYWEQPLEPPMAPCRPVSLAEIPVEHQFGVIAQSILPQSLQNAHEGFGGDIAPAHSEIPWIDQLPEYEFPAYAYGYQEAQIPLRLRSEGTALEEGEKDKMAAMAKEFGSRGPMDRPGSPTLTNPPSEMSFMDWYPKGNATINYCNASGEVQTIGDLDPTFFQKRCPLLAQAFERSRAGPKLYLEILTDSTAAPFMRYLYTGSYALPGRESNDVYEDVPTSVLLHCQMFRLAVVYDLLDLKQQAYVNVTRQCEYSCSSPEKPIDLCEAIKYVYQHLSDHANLVYTFICYCVTGFLKHRLDNDFEFRTMSFDLREFQKDLVAEVRKREFQDDTAAAIISLPFRPFVPETYASRDDIAPDRVPDFVYHFHASDNYDGASKKRKLKGNAESGACEATLPLRHKHDNSTMEHEIEELQWNADIVKIGSRKRRVSTAVSSSSGEFEIIPRPSSVMESSSDSSDTDENAPVIVGRSKAKAVQDSQQSRPHNQTFSETSSITLADSETDDTEADWTLV